VDAVLVVHEPTRPRRATQQWEQVVGLQEQVGGLVHPPPARPGVPGQVVQEPAGQRARPGRRPTLVHPELPGSPEPSGADARARDGRTAAATARDADRRRRSGVGGGRGLVSGAAPRAVAHPQGAPGDHGQAAQGRGGRGDHQRLEVRGHGGRPHVPVHIHILHGGRHHSGTHVRAACHRHVIAPPTSSHPVPAFCYI